MYRKISDFLEDWKYESESTLKLFKNISDESKNQKVTENGRSLGFLAWHITNSIPDIMKKIGLNVEDFKEDSPEPKAFSETIDKYQQYSDMLLNHIKDNWMDETLSEELDMWGQKWLKGKLISMIFVHQIHHRAQMTVLMRQAGLLVPGVYGPSKEEWASMGREAQL